MTTDSYAFSGNIPKAYDEGLGPMFFEPYARDLARRLDIPSAGAVLEVAAGTGIATAHLLARLAPEGRLVVTDVNEAMMAIAQRKLAKDPRADWRVADATSLPFPDAAFDAVCCQFGFMFFPDKALAARELRRVLRDGGQLLLSVWGSLGDNPIAAAAYEVILGFFHIDPPRFLDTPFGSYDPAPIAAWLSAAGFSRVDHEIVDVEGHSATAELAAAGLVLGTPNVTQINQRGGVEPMVIVHAVAARLAREGGAAPMRLPMRAIVFNARA